jgi:hypothetical protein
VFEILGTGFPSPQQFVGTPGSSNCMGTTISHLARTYGGIAAAASSLRFSSVEALQAYVSSYCSN